MKYLIQCRVAVTVALLACIVQQTNAAVSRAFVKACQSGRPIRSPTVTPWAWTMFR